MSEPNEIPFDPNEDVCDENDGVIESNGETFSSKKFFSKEELIDPEYVEIISSDGEEVIDDEVQVISKPIVKDKPDEKITKEYEKKLIKGLFHRDI